MDCIKRDHSIKTYVNFSWLISGSIVAFTSLFAFLLAGWMEYQHSNSRIKEELFEKSNIAARRLAGELLVGKNGAVEAVSDFLKQDLRVANIELLTQEPICLSQIPKSTDACWEKNESFHSIYRRVPYVKDHYFIKVSDPSVSYVQSLQLKLLLWVALPLFSVVFIGLILQRMYLRHFILVPIQSLVSAALEEKEVPRHWPIEIKDIANRLSTTFEERDQFLLNQIATGVIHDIKALLHSILSATKLVEEQPKDSLKRPERLETLYRVCSRNVVKIKQIIEVTLDGSRDIPIRPVSWNLIHTIQNSIAVNQDLATSKKVDIQLNDSRESLSLNHDPVQLERVLVNIIKNAIEAFDHHTDIEGKAKRVQISLVHQNRGFVSVVVEDSGPGVHGPLFKPLRSTKYQGVGLGLVISRKIVQGHGGDIHVTQSKNLGGACFTVNIPRETQKVKGVTYESAISAVSSG